MTIKIEQPFFLQMDVVEIEDRVPSMKMNIVIRYSQFQHEIGYAGTVWFECEKWGAFVDAVTDGADEAKLEDISEYFSLMICRQENTSSLTWKFTRQGVDASVGDVSVTFPKIDPGLFITEFSVLDRWWEVI